ncbi:MAG: hypothetical protein KF779_05200 [Hyphomonadaceae bacterium]|nr:hypothetical protein [Hyphomonadaceae bacterium]
MRAIVTIIFTCFVAACATVVASPDNKGTSEVTERRERNYEVGVERTAVVGDSIVRVRAYTEQVTRYPAFEVTEPFRLSGGPVTLHFARGERLPIFGERTNDGVTYTVVRKDGVYGIQVAPDGSVGSGVINGLGTEIQVVMAYRFTVDPNSARLQRSDAQEVRRTPTGENFEIVFNGIDGAAMRFQYREYTADDMARPAFFQDLSYPLGTRTIRFRSMSIDVARVDAQQITYTVRAE